jgi:hypothetical protein
MPPPPQIGTETPPDHHRGGMLHSLGRVLRVELVGARRVPHLLPDIPYTAEGRLIGKHHLRPVFRGPLSILLGELFTIILDVKRAFMAKTCEGIFRYLSSACCMECSALLARAGILFFNSPAERVGSLLMWN